MIRKRRQKIYVMPHRRRREDRTNYKLRLALVKSKKPRIVVRRFLSNITCQIIVFDAKGDKVVASSDSKELKKYGWNLNCGNIPAAYLTGLICGMRAKKGKVKEAIFDSGLQTSTKGSRLYAAIKGAVDGGLQVIHEDKILPDAERIKGSHIAKFAEKMKSENPGGYKKIFADYLKNKVEPEKLPEVFDKVRASIMQKAE